MKKHSTRKFQNFSVQKVHLWILMSLLLLTGIPCLAQHNKNGTTFSDSLGYGECIFSSSGKNQYFILEPGYQLVLEGTEGKTKGQLVISVLNEIKTINGIDTRVVEEREFANGELSEVSRNYLAYCQKTACIFYFGEDVDIYVDGKIVGHEGSWIAESPNRAGILMPGLPLLGSRYYQEIAPGVAMDRAEVISVNEKISTPAGDFNNVLKTEESNALNPKELENKYYAPGIGLIREENLLLTRYGFK